MLPVRALVPACLLLCGPVALCQPPQPPGSSGHPTTLADPKPGEPPKPDPKPVARPPGLVVVTDAKWVAGAEPVVKWDQPDFDDSKWTPLTVMNGPADYGTHYALDNQFGIPSTASWVWHGQGAKFVTRRNFDAPKEIRRAEMLLIADDEADVFVNGEPVGVYRSSNMAWGHRGSAAVIDLTPYLVAGKRNCIAAKVRDNGGAKGFAADIRVNSTPLIPRALVETPEPPAKAVLVEIDRLAKDLDDREYATRETATKRLKTLARTHGQSLYDRLEELAVGGSPEARWRAEQAFFLLKREKAAVFAPTGTDGRFYYPPYPLPEVRRWWTATPESNPLAFRHLVQAKTTRDADPKAFDAALRKAMADAKDAEAVTLVGFVSNLELTELADVLVETLEKRPKTLAAALAASGLGRLGKGKLTAEQVKKLTAAAECGHEPTVRAAKAALAAN